MSDPRFPNGTPRNGCVSCHQDFTSIRLFDAHHVGNHAYDFSADHLDGYY